MTPAEKPRWCPPNLETSLHQRFLSTAKRLHLKGAHLGEELERLWSLEELIWFIKEHWMKWRRGEEETIKQQSLCFKSWHHFQPLWSRGPAESCQGQGGLLSGKSGPWVPRRIFRAWESKRIFSLLELGQNRPRLPGSAALAQNGRVWPFCFLGFVSSQPGWDGKIKTKQTPKNLKIKPKISQKKRGRFSIIPQHCGDPQRQFEPLIQRPARNPLTQKAENRPKTHLGHTLCHGKAIKNYICQTSHEDKLFITSPRSGKPLSKARPTIFANTPS